MKLWLHWQLEICFGVTEYCAVVITALSSKLTKENEPPNCCMPLHLGCANLKHSSTICGRRSKGTLVNCTTYLFKQQRYSMHITSKMNEEEKILFCLPRFLIVYIIIITSVISKAWKLYSYVLTSINFSNSKLARCKCKRFWNWRKTCLNAHDENVWEKKPWNKFAPSILWGFLLTMDIRWHNWMVWICPWAYMDIRFRVIA